MTTQTSRILIVDDHPMVREGLALRINRESDLAVCCEADDMHSAMSCCERCAPDLALVDLTLSGASGLSLTKNLVNHHPQLRILMVSMHDENVYAERALQAGAHGYIMKQEATDILIMAIRQVLDGHLYISNNLRTKLVRLHLNAKESKSPISGLSAAEFEVFNLLGAGLSAREIAAELNRSVKTIESHCARLKTKLTLASGKDLVQYAQDWKRTDS